MTNKPKGVVEANVEDELKLRRKAKAEKEAKKEAKKEAEKEAEKKENKEQKKEVVKEKINNKIFVIKKSFYKLFKLKTWVNFIQSFEELFTVVTINSMMFFLLASVIFSIYFLYKCNWIMGLTSIVTFSAIAFVIDRMSIGENMASKQGE